MEELALFPLGSTAGAVSFTAAKLHERGRAHSSITEEGRTWASRTISEFLDQGLPEAASLGHSRKALLGLRLRIKLVPLFASDMFCPHPCWEMYPFKRWDLVGSQVNWKHAFERD